MGIATCGGTSYRVPGNASSRRNTTGNVAVSARFLATTLNSSRCQAPDCPLDIHERFNRMTPQSLPLVPAWAFPLEISAMSMGKRLAAEFLGTFWLVLGGCGSAVLAANFGGDGNPLGIGLLGVALAFGLTVLTGAYAFGHVSGAHFNPAVSLGLWAGGRFAGKDLGPYVIAQVLGGLLAGFILLQIAKGSPAFALDAGQAGAFASNGYGALSPGGYGVAA